MENSKKPKTKISKLLRSWESYKKDYPNRTIRSIRVDNKKDKACFLDYHNGKRIVVCLTEKQYTVEELPKLVNVKF